MDRDRTVLWDSRTSVLSTVQTVEPGGYEGWCAAWRATAGRVEPLAR
ncbi:hypothetical protein [Lentzea xinjiangensis]|nr:hypothetical protein [Lentzea xinjiangensis]